MKKLLLNGMVVSIAMLFSSCNQDIEGVNYQENYADKIPISLNTQILQAEQTRSHNNVFDSSDKISLTVLQQPNKLSGKRYKDNVKLVYKDGEFNSEEKLYYPYGKDVVCDFISYYPYSETGINPGTNTKTIQVYADQRKEQNYIESDFLAAKTYNIVPRAEAVNLNFTHKLSQIYFSLQLPDTFNISAIARNTYITLRNLCTQTTYNFETDLFEGYARPENILPNGFWSINRSKSSLYNIKAIVIPQDLSNASIELTMNGRIFHSKFPSSVQLESGCSYNINMSFDPNIGINSIQASIDDWNAGTNADIDITEMGQNISLSSLNFNKYGIYSVKNENGIEIGSICQELLRNNTIEKQAVVLYSTTNPLEGTVLQFTDKSDHTCGGKVVWNSKNSNEFTYTPGTQQPASDVYLNETNQLTTVLPQKPGLLYAQEKVLTDIRNNEKEIYPIVKIGCQYFMKEDLRTAYYNDGTPITNNDAKGLKTEEPGYAHDSDPYTFFYNFQAKETGKLAPKGWKIPSAEEWDKMAKYVNGDGNMLKKDWNNLPDVGPSTNLSGFSALPKGFIYLNQNTIKLYNMGYSIYYWNEKDNAKRSCIHLYYKDNKIDTPEKIIFDYYCVRCLKIDNESIN